MIFYIHRRLLILYFSIGFIIAGYSQKVDLLLPRERPEADINDTVQKKNGNSENLINVCKFRFTGTDFGIYNHPLEFLKGKLPALYISSLSGSPGSDYSINSMGFNSVKGNTNASILLNGLPIDNYLKFINYQDIDNYSTQFDDIKYPQFSGTDANGLLLINSKSADKDCHLFFSLKSAISWLPKQVDVLNGDEYRNLLNEHYADEPEVLKMAGNSSTNWQKEITRTALSHDAFIELLGSKGKFPMRFSYGNSITRGIIRNSDLTKNTVSYSLTPSFSDKHLRTVLNLFFTDYNENHVAEEAFTSAIFFAPSSPVYQENPFGNYFAWQNDKGEINRLQKNPVALINQLKTNERSSYFSGFLKLEYSFMNIEGLSAGINTAIAHLTQNQNVTLDTTASWYTSAWKDVRLRDKTFRIYTNPYIKYERSFKDDKFKMIIETGFFDHYGQNQTFNRMTGISVSDLSYNEMSAYASASLKHTESFDLKAKLTIYDNPWLQNSTQFYPGISGYWSFGEEKFMDWCNIFSQLSLTSSYSFSGNSPYTQSNSNIIPENLKPAITRNFNTGLAALFEDLPLSLFLDYYILSDKGIYFTRDNYAQGNYEERIINSFSMRNSGLIFNLVFRRLSFPALNYDLRLSVNYNRNRITDFNYLPGIDVIYEYDDEFPFPPLIYYTGNKISAFSVLKQKYDTNGKPLENEYETEGAVIDGIKTAYWIDRSTKPDWIAGINGNIRYKGFEFNFSGRFCLGNYVYNRLNAQSVYNAIDVSGMYLRNLTADITITGFQNLQFYSDYYVENASYFKMDVLGFGYEIKNPANKDYSLKFTLTLQNAFTVTKYTGMDPEVTDGFDTGLYPRARIFTLGAIFDL